MNFILTCVGRWLLACGEGSFIKVHVLLLRQLLLLLYVDKFGFNCSLDAVLLHLVN